MILSIAHNSSTPVFDSVATFRKIVLPQMIGVEPLYAGLIAHTTAYEQLALEAALHGGRNRVYDALLAHPLVGQIDLAEQLTDRLIAENGAHLSWV